MLASKFKLILETSSKRLRWNFISQTLYKINIQNLYVVNKTQNSKFYPQIQYNFTTIDSQAKKIKIIFPPELKEKDHTIAKSIKISDACKEKIFDLIKNKNILNSFLRVMVEGGGCSGYQYIFKIEEQINKEDDLIFEVGENEKDIRVVIDKISLPFLEGAIIDYKETMMKSSFLVSENPKAEISCSCGTSFSPKINKI